MRSLYQRSYLRLEHHRYRETKLSRRHVSRRGYWFVTRKYERIYNEDMATLGVALPDIQPRATETIPEMISLIEYMIQRGHAYGERHIYSVPSF